MVVEPQKICKTVKQTVKQLMGLNRNQKELQTAKNLTG